MKAASYGKAFCPTVDSNEFVSVAKKLRILNDIRTPNVGMPLTSAQFDRLTPDVLVNRLTMRGHHILAICICESLHLKINRVLVHWASEKIKKLALTSLSDEMICNKIKEKLSNYERVSYLEIATAAYHAGRRRLATMLLDFEASTADQVPLLLSMNEEELALQKAVNSEDTDLIYLTLFHLERARPDKDVFHRLVLSHPEAGILLRTFYKSKMDILDRAPLHNLLMFNKNYYDAGIAAAQHAAMQSALPRKIQLLRDSAALYNQGRDLSQLKLLTEEQIELLEIQKGLELRTHQPFLDLSISETLYNIMLLPTDNPTDILKWNTEFNKIVKKFKVSEKTIYSIKIHCFSQTNQWDAMSKLANEKKSPIGYKPFALACIR